jgi:hypothetical protein
MAGGRVVLASSIGCEDKNHPKATPSSAEFDLTRPALGSRAYSCPPSPQARKGARGGWPAAGDYPVEPRHRHGVLPPQRGGVAQRPVRQPEGSPRPALDGEGREAACPQDALAGEQRWTRRWSDDRTTAKRPLATAGKMSGDPSAAWRSLAACPTVRIPTSRPATVGAKAEVAGFFSPTPSCSPKLKSAPNTLRKLPTETSPSPSPANHFETSSVSIELATRSPKSFRNRASRARRSPK